jgi:hypothetical protein
MGNLLKLLTMISAIEKDLVTIPKEMKYAAYTPRRIVY